jgi:hypothetical protein
MQIPQMAVHFILLQPVQHTAKDCLVLRDKMVLFQPGLVLPDLTGKITVITAFRDITQRNESDDVSFFTGHHKKEVPLKTSVKTHPDIPSVSQILRRDKLFPKLTAGVYIGFCVDF